MGHTSQAGLVLYPLVHAEGCVAVAGLCDRLLILTTGSSQTFRTRPEARVKQEADAIDLTALPLPRIKCGKRFFKAGALCSCDTHHHHLDFAAHCTM